MNKKAHTNAFEFYHFLSISQKHQAVGPTDRHITR